MAETIFAKARHPRRATKWAVAVALLGIACLPMAMPAHAEDDEDERGNSLERTIMRSLMGGAGADIDYRERSPLVIPPARNLPQPGQRAAVQGNTGWPNDPDKRPGATHRGGPRSAVGASDAEARNLGPAEMRRGAVRGAGRGSNRPVPTPDDNEMGRALRPNELGAPTLFQSFSMFGGRGDQPVQFEREPSRNRMTDPPVGLRTPSTAQPYKAPPSTSILKVPTFFDRGTDPNQ